MNFNIKIVIFSLFSLAVYGAFYYDDTNMRGTQARIHLANLEHNIRQIKKNCKAKLCVSVKANAYGHGSVCVARKVLDCGADYLAVASVDEGRLLREEGITAPILLFSLTVPEEIPDIIRLNLTPFVFDEECIDLLDNAAGKSFAGAQYPLHLKIDTGMARIGCKSEDAPSLARRICASKHLRLEGMCTHFAVSDSLKPDDIAYTKNQIAVFKQSADAVQRAGIEAGIRHCAASGGILMYPEAHFDMVRAGIIAYGYFPSEELKTLPSKPDLKPVMELVAPVVSIKELKAGQSVSYGRAWTAKKDTRIATLPIGYGDGLLRNLSPGFSVAIHGERYPIVGRICMDQCMVDIGASSRVKRWDEAVIFGTKPNEPTAEDAATLLHTIHYEILTGISARVPRVVC